ncbi:MAG: sensor histidine kinase, partial [Trebonia sp.]
AVAMHNPAAQRMGLLRGDELALNELRELARVARRTETGQQAEVRLLHGWWHREPAAVHARAVPLGHGGHVALLVEDVTDARRVADMRRDFVANVSHELNTPVGALALLGEALQQASEDPDAVRRFGERIGHESRRLARLVAELIELSRLEAPATRDEPETVSVAQLVAEAADRTRLAGETRHITISTGAEPGLELLGHRDQLITAVVNLVDNAIAYSPEETSVQITAWRTADRDAGDSVAISVTDQGIGIDEADRDRIFERFYRADPARSRATGGTGLGLAIVKHIVANHAGQISVDSRPGHGSTFTLTLPTAPPRPAAPTSPASSDGAAR